MEELRRELIKYIEYKFSNIYGISSYAEDIVHDAWLKSTKEEHFNFGYLSVVCIRLAYRLYRKQRNQSIDVIDLLISEEEVVTQIIEGEQADLILQSLDTLREIEKKIVLLRYYEDCSFSEISRKIGVNLNTVLTIHRRALDKLRPRLCTVLDISKEKKAKSFKGYLK